MLCNDWNGLKYKLSANAIRHWSSFMAHEFGILATVVIFGLWYAGAREDLIDGWKHLLKVRKLAPLLLLHHESCYLTTII